MISFSQPSRPDRCELCHWVATETRYLPPPPGSIRTWNPTSSCSYAPSTESTSVLVCKRMPPSANEEGRGVSPSVWAGDYCGEFKEKECA
jgi:hypothetical protein